jgi:hypothetical protein
VVTALARAQLTLQTATTVRDRVVQAYQDIMNVLVLLQPAQLQSRNQLEVLRFLLSVASGGLP